MLRATTASTLTERPRVVRTCGIFIPFLTFDMCFAPQRRATTSCTFSTSQRPRVVQTCGDFTILTWKCASRHNGVHFFNISTSVHFLDRTSKTCPNLWCLYHFDLDMCFVPQRRALLRHLNFQKLCENGVLCTF